MSVTADIIQHLVDAGMGGTEIIAVAKAMERGEDRDEIFRLQERLLDADCPSSAVGIAIHAVAVEISQRSPVFVRRVRDEHSAKKDSNKSRRGMSNEAWRELREQIYKRDGYECQYCGSDDDLTCDHILPLVRGGTNDPDNLTTACRICNSSKGGKTLTEWRGVPQ